MVLTVREALAQQRQKKLDEVASKDGLEIIAKEVVAAAIQSGVRHVMDGATELPRKYEDSQYNWCPHTDRKHDSPALEWECFHENCIKNFDATRLQGLAKLVHDQLSTAPNCFWVSVVNKSNNYALKFAFKIRWA